MKRVIITSYIRQNLFELKVSVKIILAFILKKFLSTKTYTKLKFYFYYTIYKLTKNNTKLSTYLSPNVTFSDFFRSLNESGIRYVVLRSFYDNSFINNNDLDILILEEDLVQYQLVCKEYTTLKLQITPRIEVHSKGYYPDKLYFEVIHNRIKYDDFYIPSNLDLFNSLLFHVLVNKSNSISIGNHLPKSKHLDNIHSISQLVGLSEVLKDDLKAIKYLADNGYVVNQTENIYATMGSLGIYAYDKNDILYSSNIIIYLIRERIFDIGFESYISKFLPKGVRILLFDSLSQNHQLLASRIIRGGSWDSVGQPIHGGPPSAVLILFDENPRSVPKLYKDRFPNTNNYNLIRVKSIIRKKTMIRIPPTQQFHFIHGPDSNYPYKAYYSLLSDGQLDRLRLDSINHKQNIY